MRVQPCWSSHACTRCFRPDRGGAAGRAATQAATARSSTGFIGRPGLRRSRYARDGATHASARANYLMQKATLGDRFGGRARSSIQAHRLIIREHAALFGGRAQSATRRCAAARKVQHWGAARSPAKPYCVLLLHTTGNTW